MKFPFRDFWSRSIVKFRKCKSLLKAIFMNRRLCVESKDRVRVEWTKTRNSILDSAFGGLNIKSCMVAAIKSLGYFLQFYAYFQGAAQVWIFSDHTALSLLLPIALLS